MSGRGWIVAALALLGCGPKTDAQFQDQVANGMHDSLLADLNDLLSAVKDLQAAAPTPAGRGLDATQDATAIASMRAAWIRARASYEHVEGALAPLFPDVDFAIDARYDDYLAELGPQGDNDLFDSQGVTGMHAIERILYADVTPQRVIDFESVLPGYRVAALPAAADEAQRFKNGLCAQLVSDVQSMRDQWTPQRIDVPGAFDGLIALMDEQREKVNKASSHEEESRYSQRTMVDIRNNLEGTKKIYALFQPWLEQRDGEATDRTVENGFSDLDVLYAQVPGDAIPPPPDTWQAEHPSAEDLQTPFGKLYSGVQSAVDPARDSSVVSAMTRAAVLIGFPETDQ